MPEAARAVSLLPMSKDGYDRIEHKYLKQHGLGLLSELGTVLPETLEMDVIERTVIGGLVMTWEVDGVRLPDDSVMVRFSAYVVPNEENKEAAYGR